MLKVNGEDQLKNLKINEKMLNTLGEKQRVDLVEPQ